MKLDINGIKYLGVTDIRTNDEVHGAIVNKSKYLDLYDNLNVGEMTINNIANKNMIVNAIDIDWNGAEIYDSEGNIQVVNSTSDLLKIINKLSKNVLNHGYIVDETDYHEKEDHIIEYSYNYLLFTYDENDSDKELKYIDKVSSNNYTFTVADDITTVCVRLMLISNGKGRIVFPKDAYNSYEILSYNTMGQTLTFEESNLFYTLKFDNTNIINDSIITVDFRLTKTSILKNKLLKIYKYKNSNSNTTDLYKAITFNIMQNKKYFWYVGTVDPLTIESITQIVTDSTSPGWRLIGDELPNYNQYNKLWSKDDVINLRSMSYWYLCVPESYIKIHGTFTDQHEHTLMDYDYVTISGVKYYIYKSYRKAKYIGFDIY